MAQKNTLFFTLKLLTISFFLNNLCNSSNFDDLEMVVHAIGQGNCVTIKIPNINPNLEPEYMLVDLGTTGYKNEKEILKKWSVKWQDAKNQLELRKQEEAISPTKLLTLDNIETPESIKHPTVQSHKLNTKNKKTAKDRACNKLIRWFYGWDKEMYTSNFEISFSETPPKIIKTVIITHPDADHHNLLRRILDTEKSPGFIIDSLILGGLPSRYQEKEHFMELFKNIKAKNSKCNIFFAATAEQYPIISSNYSPCFYHKTDDQIDIRKKKLKSDVFKEVNLGHLDEILDKLINKTSEKEKALMEAFKKAFDFGNKEFKAWCVCANALHAKGESGFGIRMADDAIPFKQEGGLEENEGEIKKIYSNYNNTDSIVIKF